MVDEQGFGSAIDGTKDVVGWPDGKEEGHVGVVSLDGQLGLSWRATLIQPDNPKIQVAGLSGCSMPSIQKSPIIPDKRQPCEQPAQPDDHSIVFLFFDRILTIYTATLEIEPSAHDVSTPQDRER